MAQPKNNYNTQIIEEFRANEGKSAARSRAHRWCSSTTRARSPARLRTNPLVYLQDGDRYYLRLQGRRLHASRVVPQPQGQSRRQRRDRHHRKVRRHSRRGHRRRARTHLGPQRRRATHIRRLRTPPARSRSSASRESPDKHGQPVPASRALRARPARRRDGQQLYWEICGNPAGRPALILHGGPGSGCTPRHRRLFDPGRYRIVLFDQRNCRGRRARRTQANPSSTSPPIPAEPRRRHRTSARASRHRRVARPRRLLGQHAALGITYAEHYTGHVSEMVLFGVTTGRHSEFDWAFRGGAAFFPEQWGHCVNHCRRPTVAATSSRPTTTSSSTPTLKSINQPPKIGASGSPPPPHNHRRPPASTSRPAYAVAFARIVTHYVRHNAWLDDGILCATPAACPASPGPDQRPLRFRCPIGNAWTLQQAWPRAELVIVDESGHTPTAALEREVTRATDAFA